MKNLLTNISILIVTVAICFVLMEIITRIYLVDYWDEGAIRRRMLPLKDYITPSNNPKLLYELKKYHTVVDHYGVEYEINGTGERIAGPQMNGKKVAIIGDSTSFGWGVPAGAAYPFLLVTMTDGRYDVRNFSVPGYNTQQEREVYLTKVKQWKPDIVIIHHDGNDADPVGRYFYEDVRDPKYGNNRIHSALLKVVIRTLNGLFSQDGIPKDTPTLNYSIAGGPLLEQHIQDLSAFVEEVRADGPSVYVFMWDAFISTEDIIYTDKNWDLLHHPYTEAFKDDVLIDPYWDFRDKMQSLGTSARDYWLSPTDAHPNAEMHQWITSYIIERIK